MARTSTQSTPSAAASRPTAPSIQSSPSSSRPELRGGPVRPLERRKGSPCQSAVVFRDCQVPVHRVSVDPVLPGQLSLRYPGGGLGPKLGDLVAGQ